MDSLARIGMMATCVIAIYVGARTLWIWRSTRMIQELCIGTNMLSIAVGGLILTIVGALGASTGQAPARIPLGLGLLGLVVHVVALYIGTWKIFRPADGWPLALVGIATALSVGWMISGLVLSGSDEWLAERSVMFLTVRGVGMTWAGYECFRYSAMLRKRAAVGLGDPMIAHRIWLWGLGAVASLITIGLDFASWGTVGVGLGTTAIGLTAMSLLGVIGTCSIGAAFFPPAFYVRMVERRFETTSVTA